MGIREGLSRMSWKLSRTVLRGGVTGNGGSLLDAHQGKEKTPYFIYRKDLEPMAFAGIWDAWKGPEGSVESCSILTTDANSLVAKIHDRMPVILSSSEFDTWLDREMTDIEKLKILFSPYPSDMLEAFPVSDEVNNPQNDSPECCSPVMGDEP